jgi:Tol biopolymer transport system component
MSLAPGVRIGPYEVVSLIGAGGMGEVYRGRDTKLGRAVAIKILPESFANDPERLARFEREAKTLASLNHPNIAIIHGFEEAHGIQALVMELVEGPTLADRIAEGPLSMDEALSVAKQIAEALAAAHEQGIVHRDLKPANIKIRSDGTVKVLDFGLAKAIESVARASSSSQAPTITSPAMTHIGVILGTAAYMAPEQARGQPLDKRTDIWAFGCVLYEVLTGRRAFEGQHVNETLASVLKAEPDWTALAADTPTAIRLLVQRCLAKDLRSRIPDISVVLFVLKEATAISPAFEVAPRSQHRVRALIAVTAACVIGTAALVGLVLQVMRRPVAPNPQRVSIVLPADRSISFTWGPGLSLAISPAGTDIVYVSYNPDAPVGQREQLQVRSLASLVARDLPGTYGARQPFFSPDGRWAAFFTPTGELKKVSLAGGNPLIIVDHIDGSEWSFGVWLDDNTIVFGGYGTGGLQRVPADGGPSKHLTRVDAAQSERAHFPASFVADAGAVLFVTAFQNTPHPRIDAVILSSGDRRVVLDKAMGFVAGEHLVFQRNEALLMAPFDGARLRLAGSPVPLLDEVRQNAAPQMDVSSNGTLAYVPAVDQARTIGRVDRNGAFDPLGPPQGRISGPRVSPDGQRVAFALGNTQGGRTLHIYDLVRGTTTKVTQSGTDVNFAWRPDGKGIAVFSFRQDGDGIYLNELGGTERLLRRGDGASLLVESWSPDGSALAITRQVGSQHDIWLLDVGDKPTARPFINSPANEHSPKFSPDGRWLAYISDVSGRSEVYVRGYPDGEPEAFSTDGGMEPVWSPDGRSIIFRTLLPGTPQLVGVPATVAGGTLKRGAPTPVLNLRVAGPTGVIEAYVTGGTAGPQYDIFPDGRFVMVRGPDPRAAREIVIVQHWFEELKRLVPRN